MRLRVERDALVGGLKAVVPATGKASMPVLTGVRIDAGTGRVDFTCSSLELTIRAAVDGVDAEPGDVIVPARLLERIAQALPSGAVELEARDDQLTVTCGDTCAELHTLAPDGWPRLPTVDAEPVVLGAEALADLRHIAAMASPERGRKGIWGVRFAGTQAVATDSYRMGAVELGVEVPEVILPADSLTPVLRTATDELAMAVGRNAAAFTAGNVTWTSTVVEDPFPPIEQFLNMRPPRRLELSAHRLAEAIDRATTVGTERNDANVVRLTVDGGKVLVSRRQVDVGSVVDAVPCAGDWEGCAAFNPEYLSDLVSAVAAHQDEVVLEVEPAETGGVLKPVLARTERFTLLVMPVRLPEAAGRG